MDFIEGLPKSHGYEVIFVVVDKLTKFVHFIPLSHLYTVAKVAAVFMKNVFKLHGMPKTIISDRGSVFTAHFWQELFKLQGTELVMFSAYHPQSDGQTEVVNRSLEQYLRAFVGDKPNAWADWLHLAEYWFNTNFHTSTKLTPFEALYGIPPPSLLDYIHGATQVAVVDQLLQNRQDLISLLKQNLLSTQARMKSQADLHRSYTSFSVNDWVYLKLQPYRQHSLRLKGFNKLSPRFYGPFQVVQKVGQVAYKLALPTDCSIHLVFHVSCLKLKLGSNVVLVPTLPPVTSAGVLNPEPIAILNHRTKQLQSRTIFEVLVQWHGHSLEDATWESLYTLLQQFPQLVGKVL